MVTLRRARLKGKVGRDTMVIDYALVQNRPDGAISLITSMGPSPSQLKPAATSTRLTRRSVAMSQVDRMVQSQTAAGFELLDDVTDPKPFVTLKDCPQRLHYATSMTEAAFFAEGFKEWSLIAKPAGQRLMIMVSLGGADIQVTNAHGAPVTLPQMVDQAIRRQCRPDTLEHFIVDAVLQQDVLYLMDIAAVNNIQQAHPRLRREETMKIHFKENDHVRFCPAFHGEDAINALTVPPALPFPLREWLFLRNKDGYVGGPQPITERKCYSVSMVDVTQLVVLGRSGKSVKVGIYSHEKRSFATVGLVPAGDHTVTDFNVVDVAISPAGELIEIVGVRQDVSALDCVGNGITQIVTLASTSPAKAPEFDGFDEFGGW